jgi:hypothetical protein
VIERSSPAPQHRRGRIGRLRLTPVTVVVGLALIGSALFILWVVAAIDEDQIPLLASGFVVMGASFTAIAIGSIVGMWRAASRAHAGRALVLAIVGGMAALAAIGCFTITALSALVWTS